jgi:hypothetical protein
MIGRRRRRTPARQQPIGRGGTRRRRYMPTTMARQQPIGTQRRRRRTPAMQQPLSNRAASLSAALNRRRGRTPARQQPMPRQPSLGLGARAMGFFNEGGKMSADDKKLMKAYKKGSDKTYSPVGLRSKAARYRGAKAAVLKKAPEGSKGKGLKKLPEKVRNKMGYKAKGGSVVARQVKGFGKARKR